MQGALSIGWNLRSFPCSPAVNPSSYWSWQTSNMWLCVEVTAFVPRLNTLVARSGHHAFSLEMCSLNFSSLCLYVCAFCWYFCGLLNYVDLQSKPALSTKSTQIQQNFRWQLMTPFWARQQNIKWTSVTFKPLPDKFTQCWLSLHSCIGM